MQFGMMDRGEMLRQLGVDISSLSEEDQRSLQLAVSTFAYAYLSNPDWRVHGLIREDYEKLAEQIIEADASRRGGMLEGADGQMGLELMLQLDCCTNQGDLQRHIAPTQRGDLAIRYIIGKMVENDGRYN